MRITMFYNFDLKTNEVCLSGSAFSNILPKLKIF